MKYDKIEGIDKDISKLVMGCDNQDDINEASMLWDHWIEVGGKPAEESPSLKDSKTALLELRL